MQRTIPELVISPRFMAFLNKIANVPDNTLRLYILIFTTPLITAAFFTQTGVNLLPTIFTSLFLLLWAPKTRKDLLSMSEAKIISGLMKVLLGVLVGFGFLIFAQPVPMWPLGLLGLKVNMGIFPALFSLAGLKSKQNVIMQTMMPAPFTVKVASVSDGIETVKKPISNRELKRRAAAERKRNKKK